MRYLFLIIILFNAVASHAQDRAFGKSIVDTLTNSYFWGRGYTNDGMKKAADFIAAKFKSYGLQPLSGDTYLQPFSHSVNSFPAAMNLKINGRLLVPGKDYIISPESKGTKSKGILKQVDSTQFVNPENRILITLKDRLTWSVSPEVADYTAIELNKNAVQGNPVSFEINIENEWVEKFKTANICAMVKGTIHPDSIILITAHYDHLGGMGKSTYFPGANDNASGIALLLNLARYYASHPQPYSIAFICFAGEEIGLKGSEYYTQNPLLPLNKIRFLLNTDLAGTGNEGITIVNATEFPDEFNLMNEINDTHHLLTAIKSRGKAPNSDHYFFTEKGVPSFFFYTMGGIDAYHDINDRAETLPLNEHEDLFILITKFNDRLMNKP